MTESTSDPGCLLALLRADIVDSTGRLSSQGIDAAIDDRRRLTELVGAHLPTASGSVLATEGDAIVMGFRCADDAIWVGTQLSESSASA